MGLKIFKDFRNSLQEFLRQCVRLMLKFIRKYWIARVLKARLLETEKDEMDLLAELKATAAYRLHHEMFESVLKMPTPEMQAWVRKKFWSTGADSATQAYKSFVLLVVKPSLSVDPHATNPALQLLAKQFTSLVRGGQLNEVDSILAKIAEAASSGLLASNPAVMGIVTSSIELLQRSWVIPGISWIFLGCRWMSYFVSHGRVMMR